MFGCKNKITYQTVIDVIKSNNIQAWRQCYALMAGEWFKEHEDLANDFFELIMDKSEGKGAGSWTYQRLPFLLLCSSDEIDAVLKPGSQKCAAAAIYFIKEYLIDQQTNRRALVNPQALTELIEKTNKSDINSEFNRRITQDLSGCYLDAGSTLLYSVLHPTSIDTVSPVDVLKFLKPGNSAKIELSSCDGKAGNAEQRKKLPFHLFDVVCFWMFAYLYQVETPHHTDFADNFYIPWHMWGLPKARDLVELKHRHQPRRPIICHIGESAWMVHDHQLGCFMCDNSVNAIAIWIFIVKTRYNNTDEFHNELPEILKNSI